MAEYGLGASPIVQAALEARGGAVEAAVLAGGGRRSRTRSVKPGRSPALVDGRSRRSRPAGDAQGGRQAAERATARSRRLAHVRVRGADLRPGRSKCSRAGSASPSAACSEPRLKCRNGVSSPSASWRSSSSMLRRRLVLVVAHDPEVAEVLHADVGAARGARASAGSRWAICSWMRPSKRYSGRLRKTRSALWVTAVPSSRAPVWLCSTR